MGSEKCEFISQCGKTKKYLNRQAAQTESEFPCQITRKNNIIYWKDQELSRYFKSRSWNWKVEWIQSQRARIKRETGIENEWTERKR